MREVLATPENRSIYLRQLEPMIEDFRHTLFLWRKTPLAMIGSFMILFFLILAIFSPLLMTFDPYALDMNNRLVPPNNVHFFGTDQYGRDIFSRILYGARIEIWIVFLVSTISVTVGVVVGLLSGFFGGVVDEILMRITDMFMAFPRLILAMAFTALLGPNLTNTIIAIALVDWTIYARLTRAEAIKVKKQPYIEAIEGIGAGWFRVMTRHVLPMSISPVVVQMTLRMGTILLTAAGLGFLGLGARPPIPEWGAIVSEGRSYFAHQWWIATFPGIAIAIVVLGFNFIGDGLRDIMDPKIRR